MGFFSSRFNDRLAAIQRFQLHLACNQEEVEAIPDATLKNPLAGTVGPPFSTAGKQDQLGIRQPVKRLKLFKAT